MGTYQTQSPPPIADYNLSVPWSDPVPLMSPVASLPEEQRPLDTPNPTHNSFELNAVQSPIDSDQPHDSWPSGEPNSSKVSEDKSPGSQPQTVEGRRQSRASSISPLPGIQRTGTIDDVIQAWTKPIQPDQPVTNSTPWDDPGFAPVLRQLSKLVKTNDPYQDLPSESRASLERFVSMLRKESEAESDKEKFEVFSAFVQKETRLRAVLYGHDPNPLQPHKASKDGDKSAQETSPGEHDVNPSPPTQAAAENHASETQDSYNDRSPATPKFRDDSYVVVNQDHGPANDPQELPAEVKTSTPEPSVTTPVQSGKVARMLQDTIEAPQEHSAEAVPAFKPRPLSADAPILVEPEPDLIPPKATNVASNDPHVANSPPPSFSRANKPYRPFQYQVLPNRGSSQYTMQTASTQSYAALRKANSGSGRTTIIPPMSMNQSYPRLPTRQEQAEAFLGLVRQRSENEGRTMSLTGSKSDIISPHRGIDADLEAIRRIVPETLPSYIESPELTKIRFSLKDIPDEFSFIHAAVLKWNRGVLERKKRNDSERHRRQEEAERNIDALFNDNQIGYADIATLEAENRAEEAKIATGEEMEDVQTFVKEVFEVVSGTIQGQLNSLAQVYSEAMTLVESQSVSGSQFIRKPSSRTALPQAMDTLLVIYSKMQVRHQKLLEAALERSRRTRKARVTGLRAEGKAAEAQDCEISLLKEEQDMIIDAKEKDDDRANFLMDTFDKMAVLRGLAENQNFVDELHPSLRTIATTLETNVSTYDYDILRSILLSTQSALDFITADSISILKFSSIADEILNNADYDVSVAKAYRNDASPQEFKALEREKVKEDQNIKAEMAAKVEGMSSGSREVQDLVKNLLDKLEESPDHKKRLEEALERAKKRNAEAKIG
ncbi:putative tpa: zn 2cys6 transcription factor [Phaeomoniella chlamydospora]|uniref:Putative tpa: zn 2cys6 transcription factor n=1 Tax=Phaeomoniella chlamydospora TaxID=158046 RepID=A0A0G2GKG7_PHACM|nr:putative tpa: zn 2cys6 transcription factor [Phaeomoniella chlamydospora]